MSDSPPDVWRLLEQALSWVGTSYGTPEEFAKLNPLKQEMIDAIAQGDRWELVPARIGTLLLEATSEGFEGEGWTDESWADWWSEMKAAIAKP